MSRTRENAEAGDVTVVDTNGDVTLANDLDVVGHISFGSIDTVPLATDATKLQTARTIQISGDATGSASFDGSGNINIAVTVSAAAAIGPVALGAFNGGGTPVWRKQTGFNATITDAGIGLYDILFASPLADSDYVAVVTGGDPVNTARKPFGPVITNRTVNGFRIEFYGDASGNNVTLRDSDVVSVVVYE